MEAIQALPNGVLRLCGLSLCIGQVLYGYPYFFDKRQEAVELSKRNTARKH